MFQQKKQATNDVEIAAQVLLHACVADFYLVYGLCT